MLRVALAFVVVLLLATPGVASASLESFLNSVNVQARADLPGFSMKLGAQFGVPVPQVEAVLGVVATPADAFMVLQLGHMAHRQPATVTQTYQRHRGKGWGVIAKELGIKPGSAEFHAFKSGDLVFDGVPVESKAKGKGKGKSKGKGQSQ
jgi:hypothetical protein